MAGELQANLYNSLSVLRGKPEATLRLSQLLIQTLDLVAEISFSLQHSSDGIGLGLSRLSIQSFAFAQHGLFHLLGYDGPYLAEVRPDGVHLVRRHHQELEIGLKIAWPGSGTLAPLLVSLAHEVVDAHFLGPLAVTVDTAVSLLQSIGVPGYLEVDQSAAMVLQVDALGGGVGSE